MTTDDTIIAVRISRKLVGVKVPYDKIYLFPRSKRELIPKLFGYALVLPFDEMLLKGLRKSLPAFITTRTVKRNDELLKVPVDKNLDPKRWWDEFIQNNNIEDRVAVVPILLRVRALKAIPRYLTSGKWFLKHRPSSWNPTIPAPISELAYLATPHPAPNDKVRPLCSICPRSLLQLQGECMPGQPICYQTLDFNSILRDSSDDSVQPDDSGDTGAS